jgi:hypothetical protein
MTWLKLSGTLKRNAQVRTHLSSDGLHESPGLFMELEHLKGTVAGVITLMLPCTSYTDAETKAKDLLKGRVIHFEAPAEQARVFFPSINNIVIH